MKKEEVVKSLLELKEGLVIIGTLNNSTKDYIFIVKSIGHDQAEKTSEIEFVEINPKFSTWKFNLQTEANEKSEFISKEDADLKLICYTTKHVAKDLYHVLLYHLTPEE